MMRCGCYCRRRTMRLEMHGAAPTWRFRRLRLLPITSGHLVHLAHTGMRCFNNSSRLEFLPVMIVRVFALLIVCLVLRLY